MATVGAVEVRVMLPDNARVVFTDVEGCFAVWF